jgi:hypothetical protein
MNLSEALLTFSDHLPDIRKACVENAKHIQQTPHKEWDVDNEPVSKESIWLHVQHIDVMNKTAPMLRTIKRIDNRQRHVGIGQIADADIERAREYPIKELWNELVGTPMRAGMVQCCFHPDDTASMSLRRHNRYHCFGCDAKGDVIDLYMKTQGVGFIQAVKKLI